jgi:hypothetical protein
MRSIDLGTRHVFTFSAGAGATLAMMAVSRATASPVMPELQDLAATAMAERGSTAGAALGFAAQLVNGGLFAQVYDAAFDHLSLKPGLAAGAGVGLVHGALAGMVLGALPAVHPRVPEQHPRPGVFLYHRQGGRGAAALIALHVLYGALVGGALAAIRDEEREDRR